jgi:hypothetical protein
MLFAPDKRLVLKLFKPAQRGGGFDPGSLSVFPPTSSRGTANLRMRRSGSTEKGSEGGRR